MSHAKSENAVIMRSMLGRARGRGAAKAGVAHWWAQRFTALALVPLSVWFICAVIRLAGLPRAAVHAWASSPLAAALLLALIAAGFHHMQLSVQAVMDDYIYDERRRFFWVMLVKGAAGLLALVCVVATLKLAITG
jgi:succinate dehydrogenase / fumarate reductase membrane anchor subunit